VPVLIEAPEIMRIMMNHAVAACAVVETISRLGPFALDEDKLRTGSGATYAI